MVVSVWVLNEPVVIILVVVAPLLVVVVSCDVGGVWWGPGCENRGWGACRGPMGRLCRVWRRFSGTWGWFGAGEAVLVAVADGDMAVSVGSSGCE